MIGYVRQVTPFELASFRRTPSKIKEMLDAETMSAFPPGARAAIQQMQEMVLHGQLDSAEMERLEQQFRQEMDRPGSASLVAEHYAHEEEKVLRLEKRWHVLHYLLTDTQSDTPPSLANAILGGTSIGPDIGYGPARFLTPRQVQETAASLAEITTEELSRRFNPAAMEKADLYPRGYADNHEFEDILCYFEKLVAYYYSASEAGNGMLLYIR
jgi:hypothetical protein